jgi:hypothetical protein
MGWIKAWEQEEGTSPELVKMRGQCLLIHFFILKIIIPYTNQKNILPPTTVSASIGNFAVILLLYIEATS